MNKRCLNLSQYAVFSVFFLSYFTFASTKSAQGREGYYRYPATDGKKIIFTSEGDLWFVAIQGGKAQRLTTHLGSETHAKISPDGSMIAFTGQYYGTKDLYVMPADGGTPTRLTWGAEKDTAVGWTSDGNILYSTRAFSTLPNAQLVRINSKTRESHIVPLAQASDGVYDNSGTLFFCRLEFQGSHTKGYRGGTVQSIWKFAQRAKEAEHLTSDYPGTSKQPMMHQNRVFFLSDRDGTMNIWSMDKNGKTLRQHTRHRDLEVRYASLGGGKIVYQIGADIWTYDIESKSTARVPIQLVSDFDQTRSRWITNPTKYLTEMSFSLTGDQIAFTSRGQIFVVPRKDGRLVNVTKKYPGRFRNAVFLDGRESLLALGDASGEVEFYQLDSHGLKRPKQITHDGRIFRFGGVPSPDGKWFAYVDNDFCIWVRSTSGGNAKRVATSEVDDEPTNLAWSPDSRWLAYSLGGFNENHQLFVYDRVRSVSKPLTSDRLHNYSPQWSPDGKWFIFLSERNLKTVVPSPWGRRQPEPYIKSPAAIYLIGLQKGLRSPFEPPNELYPGIKKKKQTSYKNEAKKKKTPKVKIDFADIENRLWVAPYSPGNLSKLRVNSTHLFWLETTPGQKDLTKLIRKPLSREDRENTEKQFVIEKVSDYRLSADGKALLIRKNDDSFFVFDADDDLPEKNDIKAHKVDLKDWRIELHPQDEWRQMFDDAWRLERDYFYDKRMHGVDWLAKNKLYQPLVERVQERGELDDILSQLVAELGVLHTFVIAGEMRKNTNSTKMGYLGATWKRDANSDGYRIVKIYRTDPEHPIELSPLLNPGVLLQEGDIIQTINGTKTLSVSDPHILLANQADRSVRLSVLKKDTRQKLEVIVRPIDAKGLHSLRYASWEYDRRLRVEKLGNGKIGYVHLRDMTASSFEQWVREYYPIFDRQGLILDVRNNQGGNIDSWILEKLMRRAWFYWKPRVGKPFWNMQHAFRGHMVVLQNEKTSSDGEAFSEGFRRLRLGKIIGTRTWGGEIWLSFNTRLPDLGIMSVPQLGVYGPEGRWLIEGHGVEPDIVVDNLPHETHQGRDAQLEAAIEYLQALIAKEPSPVPKAPPAPKKR